MEDDKRDSKILLRISRVATQSSASGHVFLVYASLLSKLSPYSLFPAGLSVPVCVPFSRRFLRFLLFLLPYALSTL